MKSVKYFVAAIAIATIGLVAMTLHRSITGVQGEQVQTLCNGLWGCGTSGTDVLGMVPPVFLALVATVVFLLMQLMNTNDPYRL